MKTNELLFELKDAPPNAEVLITKVINGKMVSVPLTSMFVIKDPQHVLSGEVRLQYDSTHDAYTAFVSMVGVKEGTEDNFLKRYVGTWRNHESFATRHFDDTFPGCLPEVRSFINIKAYSQKIFAEDFTAFTHDGCIFVFKVL